MEVNNDLMEKYICQLIEDLEEIVKNPPRGAYIEAQPHLEGLPDIAELDLTPYKTIEEITGISIDSFPESYKLDGLQIQRVNAAIFRVFDCKIIFFPLGSQQKYDIMTNFAILQNDDFIKKLNRALNGKKIFGEFYSVVKSSGYQNEWNKFIFDQTEEHVRKMLTDKLYDPFSGNHEEINGVYNDDGTKIDPDSIPVPSKCLTCRSYYSDDWEDDILCKLTRNDQRDSDDFQCEAYESI